MSTSPTRIDFIDCAKAIGIVLVVLGHAPGLPTALRTLIYAFHMPLFFLISGYLLSEARIQRPFASQLRSQARDLLIPYALFFIASYAYWLVTRNLGARAARFGDIPWYSPLQGFASGLSAQLGVNPALWFLPCLFVTLLIYIAIRRRLDVRAAFWLTLPPAVLAILLFPSATFRLPWGLDIAFVAILFMAAGNLLGHYRIDPARWPLAVRIGALLAAGGLLLWLATLLGPTDMNRMSFGPVESGLFGHAGQPNPALYLAPASSGIALVLVAATLWSPGTITRWLAVNTLIIFPTHPIVMNLAKGVAQMGFGTSAEFLRSPTWAVLASALGLVAAVPIAVVLRRLFPNVFRSPVQARTDTQRPQHESPLPIETGETSWQRQ